MKTTTETLTYRTPRIDCSLQRRIELCEVKGITLDGKPAKIIGSHKDFALVFQVDCPVHAAEWAWDTVDRIVKNGGNFKS